MGPHDAIFFEDPTEEGRALARELAEAITEELLDEDEEHGSYWWTLGMARGFPFAVTVARQYDGQVVVSWGDPPGQFAWNWDPKRVQEVKALLAELAEESTPADQ